MSTIWKILKWILDFSPLYTRFSVYFMANFGRKKNIKRCWQQWNKWERHSGNSNTKNDIQYSTVPFSKQYNTDAPQWKGVPFFLCVLLWLRIRRAAVVIFSFFFSYEIQTIAPALAALLFFSLSISFSRSH